MQFLIACREWPRSARTAKKALFGVIFLYALTIPATVFAFWPFGPPPDTPASRPTASRHSGGSVDLNEAAVLHQQVRGMARSLLRSLADADPENGVLADGVIVCTFVDLKKLYRTSSFGRYLAEQLMTELQRRHYTVVELRKSKEVMIQEKRGEYGLSREPDRIREVVSAGAMLTGTYTLADGQVIVNARIIDNRNATLLASATAIFPRGRVTSRLLADSSSAVSRKAEPVYMKRLEL